MTDCCHIQAGKLRIAIHADTGMGSRVVGLKPPMCSEPAVAVTPTSFEAARFKAEVLANNLIRISVKLNDKQAAQAVIVYWIAVSFA
jgi:hypothetical protein